jgi:hypothetical protein
MVDLLDGFGEGALFDGLPAPGDAVAPRASTDLDGMLGGSDDDDPFSAPPPALAAPAAPTGPPAPPSALIAWERETAAELAKKDQADDEGAAELRRTAKNALDDWYALLRDQQDKRAKQNQDDQAEKLEELEREAANPWEKVGLLIDANRTDLHVRDVSRMKSLLLKLKH